ncbi:hypothetical protein MHYP_G00244920 [Metynnis hypsauchen]
MTVSRRRRPEDNQQAGRGQEDSQQAGPTSKEQCLLFLVPEFTGGGSTEEAFKHLEMLYSGQGLKSLTLLAAPERVLVGGPARLPSPHFG